MNSWDFFRRYRDLAAWHEIYLSQVETIMDSLRKLELRELPQTTMALPIHVNDYNALRGWSLTPKDI